MLFIGGDIRTTTVVALAAFALVALYRNDMRPLAYGWAWFAGFEAFFQTTSILFGRLPVGYRGPVGLIVVGLITIPWTLWKGIRPSLPLLAAAAAVWIVWVATGFHVNGHSMVGLNPSAEVFNEGAKMLWAAAYLWPILSRCPSLVVRKDVTV